MEFINKTKIEIDICEKSLIGKKINSFQINYFNKVNDKPWGKEYLAYQNNKIGIWILHVNRNQETSLHCHFKKDSILIPLSGCFRINLYEGFKILYPFDSLYFPKETFHGIHSYTDSIIMEIEVYTENITYTDKNDLLRIKDIYGRDKSKYETSVIERDPLENEIMNFEKPNVYTIDRTKITILKINSLDNLCFEKIILLNGSLYSNGVHLNSGSFIDLNNNYSFLTEYIEIIGLNNIDDIYLKKIIYSKEHLTDYKLLYKFNNIGLTSGCFDILHEGHIKNLKICKYNCEKLFVCLSSDIQLTRLKGINRPVNTLNDRIYMLIHYDFIDYIILYDETNDILETELDNIMNILTPDSWFKGSDYKKEDIFIKHPNLKNIKLIDLVEGKSTTNIINKIIN